MAIIVYNRNMNEKYNQWWTLREMCQLKGLNYSSHRLPRYRDRFPPVVRVGGKWRAHVSDVIPWRDMSDAEVLKKWHKRRRK